jgi:hypothetical protein
VNLLKIIRRCSSHLAKGALSRSIFGITVVFWLIWFGRIRSCVTDIQSK